MTATHDTPTRSTDDTLVPGRVYFIGWRDASEHPNPVPVTPDNNDRTWFYLVAILGDVLYGVAFANVSPDTAHPIGATVPAEVIRARLEGGYAHHVPTVVGWWPDMLAGFFRSVTPGTPTTSGDQDTDQVYRRGVTDGRAAASREFDAWKARAEEIAHAYADDNGLCGEFDRCMEEVGLSPRERDYRVTRVETYYVTARNEDDATERVDNGYEDADDTDWRVERV